MTRSSLTASRNVLAVNGALSIPRAELDVRVSRSSGAGGQHVNKTSSRVEIFWNVRTSGAVTEAQRALLLARLDSRLNADGSIRVVASDMRSQSRNREIAEERLAEVVRRALVVQRKRKPTKPTRAAKEARLDSKKRHSRKKDERRTRTFE
ncbi:MAG TPA: alternative ribosome rescue aminoacyl-tRNA hydrolase ArfB [Gemmatimonadaceae bacterium]|jgi:ribosome-associated protein|nr:alternative ribosome rescue aminoacyl-tRNA hydrolase ArfB [Gemmatimonadaceae bacterium]